MRWIALAVGVWLAAPDALGSGWVITDATSAGGWAITEREVVATGVEDTPGGYLWLYSDGQEVPETYGDYVSRRNLPRLTCSTGHCGKASAGPVKPAGGCPCGCRAGLCNCAHSKNVIEGPEKPEEKRIVNGTSPTFNDNCAGGNCAARQRFFLRMRRR